eukprot:9656929-Lingulodinium_polyedra.AAC.1
MAGFHELVAPRARALYWSTLAGTHRVLGDQFPYSSLQLLSLAPRSPAPARPAAHPSQSQA